MEKIIEVSEFVKKTGFVCAYEGRGHFPIYSSDINRPAMQFAGYFDHFGNQRIQLFGNQEMGYISQLSKEVLDKRLKQFFSYPIPCMVVCNGDEVPDWMMQYAKQYGVPIFKSERSASTIVHKTVDFLDDALAPEITLHANLIDVHNVGVMIRGESGMGKSELALELIKRGHVLVADDATVVRKTGPKQLEGYAPEASRGLIEIRGLGILDIRRIYGTATVLDRKQIQIVVDMEMWDQNKSYDRLGFDVQYETIMGVELPRYVMPVRPGRNLAVVIEATAMDYRMKRTGFNIEEEIMRRFKETF